jgi:spore coat protein U-like protein
MRRSLTGPIALLAWFAATPAAAQMSKAFQVSADIVNGCLVTTAGSGNWGDIALGSVSSSATGTVEADLISGGANGIQIDCTPGLTVSLSADNGNQPVGGTRQLAITGNASAKVPYQLYANGSNTPWTSQSVSLSFPAGTSHKLFPVHAKATLPGAMVAGAYSDTVRVTLSW